MQVGEVAVATRRTERYNHTTKDQATSQDSVCSSRPDHFPLTATFKISSVFAPSAAYRLLPLVDTLEQYDSLQANHRRAYSQFRWVWPFALRPALQCPLHLHLDRQKTELWGRPHFGRFSATTRNRHNSLPCPGWFFSASWSRRLNQSCRTAWPWASNASKSSLTTEWGTRLAEFFNSPRTYRLFYKWGSVKIYTLNSVNGSQGTHNGHKSIYGSRNQYENFSFIWVDFNTEHCRQAP
jgi:hypothetical protein